MFLIFYDDTCGMCQKSCIFFLKRDQKRRFFFAPLGGTTAKHELKEWLTTHSGVDSIVFVEKQAVTQSVYYYSRAIFRMLWQLGGLWSVVGLLSFLPSWLLYPADVVYRFIARHRRSVCLLPKETAFQQEHKEQFLP